jgi:fatty acid synthase
VTENLPWNGSLAGVNSFGFGGSNAHALLQRNEKEKVNGGAPTDLIPRLIVASGRTEEAVDVILKDVRHTIYLSSGYLSESDVKKSDIMVCGAFRICKSAPARFHLHVTT